MPMELSECLQNGLRRYENAGRFRPATETGKMFQAACMRVCPPTISRPCRCQTALRRKYATRRGWTIALQVREIGSAVDRKARKQVLEAARRREIDVVLVCRLDSRGTTVMDLLATFQELEHLGVGFVSGATYARPPKLTNQAVTGTGELLNRTVQEPSASCAWMLVLAANRSMISLLEGGHNVRF